MVFAAVRPPPDLSLCLGGLLSLSDVQGGHVLGGGDEVQQTDGRLQQADDSTETHQPVEPPCRFLDVMHQVEQTEEEFVSSTHHKQHRLGGVVEPEDGVSRQVDGLMTP